MSRRNTTILKVLSKLPPNVARSIFSTTKKLDKEHALKKLTGKGFLPLNKTGTLYYKGRHLLNTNMKGFHDVLYIQNVGQVELNTLNVPEPIKTKVRASIARNNLVRLNPQKYTHARYHNTMNLNTKNMLILASKKKKSLPLSRRR
jgi:hypothetical protein